MFITNYRKEQQGFTLIELLVVIAIIGILSSVVLASLNSARQKSRDARRISDVGQIQLALELYFDDNQEYADNVAVLVPTYLGTQPLDPVTGAIYPLENLTSGGTTCAEATGDCTVYHLGTDLEDNSHNSLGSDADVCPSDAPVGCTIGAAKLNTTVNGDDGDSCVVGAGADPNFACYDLTN